MHNTLSALEKRLAPAEDLFSTWLLRVFLAGVLVGSAWIDDAPPLELGALIVAVYVSIGLLAQTGAFFAMAPFENRALKVFFVILNFIVLLFAFTTVSIFASTLAMAAIG
ncbi:MAG: hypothetical protein Q8L60_15975 [Gammaproteobacteria bacterium]|nr:hypothetical protein [Gammaproteobacteria bacterium]MDP2141507.1 hypothetical protein [Gammaproteobacteria bacterium]MDP2347468.1 hypothetical protein [Gammaproteobacteria bacterium]